LLGKKSLKRKTIPHQHTISCLHERVKRLLKETRSMPATRRECLTEHEQLDDCFHDTTRQEEGATRAVPACPSQSRARGKLRARLNADAAPEAPPRLASSKRARSRSGLPPPRRPHPTHPLLRVAHRPRRRRCPPTHPPPHVSSCAPPRISPSPPRRRRPHPSKQPRRPRPAASLSLSLLAEATVRLV
jgi:hypothetical protein